MRRFIPSGETFCPIRGNHPTIKELIDFDQFCGIPAEIRWGISWGKPTHAR